jgi:multidrug efflux pump subunit AcrA (membrane-fusion protein)
MTDPRVWLILSLLCLLLFGCRPNANQSHSHESKSEDVAIAQERGGAVFKEGHGILLGDETKKSLGLKLAEVAQKDLTQEVRTVAQVYREAGEKIRPSEHASPGHAYASSMVTSEDVALMKLGQLVRVSDSQAGSGEKEGRLVHIEDELAFYTGRTEILVEIPDPEDRIKFGNKLNLSVSVGQHRNAITVPASALLKASEGDFVYVQNGEFLLRTAVKAGVLGAGEIEIAEGLYAGDVVASEPVETLWLIELRAVKGGGHSH